jgi:hypothetical protein
VTGSSEDLNNDLKEAPTSPASATGTYLTIIRSWTTFLRSAIELCSVRLGHPFVPLLEGGSNRLKK